MGLDFLKSDTYENMNKFDRECTKTLSAQNKKIPLKPDIGLLGAQLVEKF